MPGPHTRSRLFRSALALLLCAGLFSAVPVSAQIKDLLGQAGQSDSKPGEPEFRFELTPEDAQAGDEVTFSVSMKLPDGFYTYSTEPSFGGRTKIQVEETVGLTAVDEDFRADREPKKEFDPGFKREVEKFYGEVTWSRTYTLDSDAKPEDARISGNLEGQYCGDGLCIPLIPPVEFAVALSGEIGATPSEKKISEHPLKLETVPTRTMRGEERPEPIKLRFEFSPEEAQPGDTVTLSVTAELEGDWHIFALTQDPNMAGLPTKIDVTNLNGLEPIDEEFRPSKEPEVERPLENIVQEVHHGTITWTKQFRVLADAASDGWGAAGEIAYQICSKGTCRPQLKVPFTLGMVAVEQAAERATEAGAAKDDRTKATETDEELTVTCPTEGRAYAEDDVRAGGLWPFLLFAFGAGFAALLTPCVFPMIPITISFFLKQSEKKHHRPVSMATTYCLGIIATFTALGLLMAILFGAASLNQLANNPWLNLVIAGVLIFFGLNLLGLFEIRVPSWLLSWSSSKEGQGGIVGVLFMALTFTLVSFTCTFAFAGALLVWAANGEYYWPILGMLAFSAAFSLPFFFLALFPSYLKSLPKSGGWMNNVKVTMGMIEVGAAFKFLSVADLAWNPAPVMFDYALVMTAWMVMAACTGLYLLGLFRLPHDTPSEFISVPRLSFALFFLGFAGYLAVGLFAPQKPEGKVWEQIASFAPMRFETGGSGSGGAATSIAAETDEGEADIGPYLEHDGLRYALDYERAIPVAEQQNLPLFLDFTGVNCVNCRLMEMRMAKPHIHERLTKFVRVQLYTDNVPTVSDRQLVGELLDKNRTLQQDWFGDVTLPAYAIVTPDGKEVLAQFKGMERRDGEFAAFLDSGLERWTQWQTESEAAVVRR